jgi:hypothetical protein
MVVVAALKQHWGGTLEWFSQVISAEEEWEFNENTFSFILDQLSLHPTKHLKWCNNWKYLSENTNNKVNEPPIARIFPDKSEVAVKELSWNGMLWVAFPNFIPSIRVVAES